MAWKTFSNFSMCQMRMKRKLAADEEAVDPVFLHAATLDVALDNLPASVGTWHRIINTHCRKAATKFHPDKQGSSGELFHQFEKAKAFLTDWVSKWVAIEGAFPKLKLRRCSKCT